jgi:hypothetical protein
MMHRIVQASIVATLIALIALSPSGCAIVPYPVIPEVDRFDNVHLAGDTLVTVGPRVALEKISERIEKKSSKVEVIDPIVFRDSAFPQGGWQLEELLESERCRSVVDELGVRYLVLVGGGAEDVRDEMGIMMPMMMPAGFMTMHATEVLSAVVLDLESGDPSRRFRYEMEGLGVMAVWVIFVAAFVPISGRSAEKSLGTALARFFEEKGHDGELRIAVLAAEASGDPFTAYEGAPITVGRDVAVSEMVDRLSEIEADAIRGVTSREEIRSELGLPLFETPDRSAELYRFGAVADLEVRPFVYLGYFDWVARAERPYAGYLLISYGPDGTVVDLDSAFVADLRPPSDPGPLDSDRDAYEYDDFPTKKTFTVEGFRAVVVHSQKGTRERLYAERDGALLFENGDWSGHEASSRGRTDQLP